MRISEAKLPRLLLLLSILAFLAAFGAGTPAQAQKKGGGGGKVIRLGEMVIEGKVRKPEAFFIETRAPLNTELLEVKESFVNEIPAVVSDGTF
ncbi:MAG: hypothetical protein PHU25_14000 [Deltaproteobacteria bacterium]|nr:hypothetical protein [Deltaproteobacteria bacterium]